MLEIMIPVVAGIVTLLCWRQQTRNRNRRAEAAQLRALNTVMNKIRRDE